LTNCNKRIRPGFIPKEYIDLRHFRDNNIFSPRGVTNIHKQCAVCTVTCTVGLTAPCEVLATQCNDMTPTPPLHLIRKFRSLINHV
jgi:hypothetical protein